MKKPSILQEDNGAWSMRRSLALLYALVSNLCLIFAALQGSMEGVWAGLAAIGAVLVLLGYTTIETIKSILCFMRKGGCGKEY